MEPRVSSGVARVGTVLPPPPPPTHLWGGGGVERRSSSPTLSVFRSSSSFLRLPRLPSPNFYLPSSFQFLYLILLLFILLSPSSAFCFFLLSFHSPSSFPSLFLFYLPSSSPSYLHSPSTAFLSSFPSYFFFSTSSSFSLPSFSFTPPPRRFPWTHFLLLFFSFSLNSAGIFLSNGCHSVISRDLSLADR